MRKKTEISESLLDELKEQLRNNPELFQSISEIVSLTKVDKDGACKSFDDVEGELIPKIQKLGNQALGSYVQSAQQQQIDKLKKEEAGVRLREKKR